MGEKMTDSGLKYEDLTVGEGEQVESGQRVRVHYTGWLANGTKFDSSLDRGNPFTFSSFLAKKRVLTLRTLRFQQRISIIFATSLHEAPSPIAKRLAFVRFFLVLREKRVRSLQKAASLFREFIFIELLFETFEFC